VLDRRNEVIAGKSLDGYCLLAHWLGLLRGCVIFGTLCVIFHEGIVGEENTRLGHQIFEKESARMLHFDCSGTLEILLLGITPEFQTIQYRRYT
jgi:hypothetical protein